MSWKNAIRLSVLPAFLLAGSLTVAAQNNVSLQPGEEALTAIQASIDKVQAEIASRNRERESVFQSLRDTERNLAALGGEIRDIQTDIALNESKLVQLQDQAQSLQTSKTLQQELIGQYIRSAYRTGRQEYFKLLFNQENPALVSRSLRYYNYFNDARSEKVAQYNDTLKEIMRVENEVVSTTRQLNEERDTLTRRRQAEQARYSERQALLDDLDVILSGSAKRLGKLEADRMEMELLIEELRRSITNLSLGGQQEPFAGLKGHLPWPVEGSLKNNWGSSYGIGDLNWQGVTIAADAGSEIRAIHHGRVVYSDWFSNSGLLLIIDHGDGYMSLYAHNQELYREVGEWVNQGEIIATVGNTGGQVDFGLYFEIRHNGEAVNPASWCLARN